MSLSRSLSSTSVLLCLAAALPAGCGGDDSCGPGGAPAAGLVATAGDTALTYGGLTAGRNNDCPAANAPAGVVSLSIEGKQTDSAASVVTLCVARPDLLSERAQRLGGDASAEVRIVDLSGSAAGCTYQIDKIQPISGTATASGMCDNGGDPAGFALVVDGTATMTRTCGAAFDRVAITLRGRVAIGAR